MRDSSNRISHCHSPDQCVPLSGGLGHEFCEKSPVKLDLFEKPMTTNASYRRELKLFEELRELPPGLERDRRLAETCGDDSALRDRVEELLAGDQADDSFFDKPLTQPDAQLEPGVTKPDFDASDRDLEGSTVGPYRLLQKVGEGGFGVVFMAEQLDPVRRKVAVKIIKPGMDSEEDIVARFEAERQALAMMNHPNIAAVLDGGCTSDGRPYFVMELVRGVSITEYCDKKHLSTRERLHLFIDICSAVQHAHQKGIIHRDLKPSNVMITPHDGRPVVKVIDFGVAKAVDQQLTEKLYFTRYGQMIGTPQYMSPEQAEMSGLGVDTLSDVYSLGVLLYELLVGSTPLQAEAFREAGYREVQRLICEEEAAKPSNRLSTTGKQQLLDIAEHRSATPDTLASEIRGDLEWVVMKTLEKERERRYATPLDLARDLKRFLDQQPVEACPPSITYRARKFLQRNRPLVALVVSVSAALLFAAVFSTVMLRIAVGEGRKLAVALDKADGLLNDKNRALEALERQTDVVADQNKKLEKQLYRTKIRSAVNAIGGLNPTRAKELLAECPERCRDWEWHRLVYQANDSAVRVRGKQMPMFFKDSERDIEVLATIGNHSGQGRINFWDPMTGASLDNIPLNTTSELVMNAISTDQKFIAVADIAGIVSIVDLASGEIQTIATGHTDRIDGLNFSTDSKRLVTVSWDKTIKLWELASGEQIKKRSAPSRLRCAAIDPQGRFVATAEPGSEEYMPLSKLRVWSLSDLTLVKELQLPKMYARAVAFSHDGTLLAGAGGRGLTIWSTDDWEPRQSRKISDGYIRAVCFHPSKPQVLIGSESGLTQWDLDSNKTLQPVGPPPSQIYWANYSSDGQHVAYYFGNTIAVHDLNKDFRSGHGVPLAGVSDYLVMTAAYNQDGSQLAVAGTNRMILIWREGAIRPDIALHGHQESITNLIWDSKDRLFSMDVNGRLMGWPADRRQPWTLQVDPDSSHSRFHVVASIPGRNQIAVGTAKHGILIVDSARGEILDNECVDVDSAVEAVACDLKGQLLAWCDSANRLTVLNLETRQVVAEYSLSESIVREIAFSPDSRFLAVAGNRRTRLCDIEANTIPWFLENDAPGWGVAFSRSGQRVIAATGTKSRYASVIDVDDGVLVDRIRTETMFDFANSPADDTLVFYGSRGRVCRFRVCNDTTDTPIHARIDAIPVKIPYKMQRESRQYSLSSQRGNEERALSLANETLKLVPDCPEYLLTKAMALHRSGRQDAALQLLTDLKGDWNTSSRDDFHPMRLTVLREVFLTLTLNSLDRLDEAKGHLDIARELVESTFSADLLVNDIFREAADSINKELAEPVESTQAATRQAQ